VDKDKVDEDFGEAFGRIRRRMKSMGVLSNKGSANRIMYAITQKVNGNR